jgi:hypothetical protein
MAAPGARKTKNQHDLIEMSETKCVGAASEFLN